MKRTSCTIGAAAVLLLAGIIGTAASPVPPMMQGGTMPILREQAVSRL
jgi:hypothetical protein